MFAPTTHKHIKTNFHIECWEGIVFASGDLPSLISFLFEVRLPRSQGWSVKPSLLLRLAVLNQVSSNPLLFESSVSPACVVDGQRGR